MLIGKKIWALVAVVLWGGTLWGQACGPGGGGVAEHELGIRLFSLSDESMTGAVAVPSASLHSSFLKGIHYKHYDSFGAFRAQLGYARYTHDSRTAGDCFDCYDEFGEASGLKIKAGYEIYGFLGPFEPYLALDVLYLRGWYNGRIEGTGMSGQYIETNREGYRMGVGVSPAAGLRVYIGYALSLSAETNLDIAYITNKITHTQELPDPEVNTTRFTGTEFLYHPIGEFSLNVIF